MNVLGWVLSTMLAAATDAWLSLDHCRALDEVELRALAELELSRSVGVSTAVVRCEPEAFVVTVLTAQAPPQQRRVSRTSVGDAPERYLAVELAELIEISQDSPPAPVPDPDPVPVPEPPHARTPAPFAPQVWVLGGARFELGGRPGVPSGGGSLAVGARFGRRIAVRAELLGLVGARRLEEGTVRTLYIGGSAAALATLDAGRTMLYAGAGARVGERFIRGIPGPDGVQGRRHHGTTWSPLVSLGVLGPRDRRLRLSGQIDVGWTVRPVRGLFEGVPVFSAGGPWIGVSLGGGARLGR